MRKLALEGSLPSSSTYYMITSSVTLPEPIAKYPRAYIYLPRRAGFQHHLPQTFAFGALHQLTDCDVWGHRNEHMDISPRHTPLENLHIPAATDLRDRLSEPLPIVYTKITDSRVVLLSI